MVHGVFLAALLTASGPPAGDRLDGFVLPVEPLQAGITLKSLSAWAWEVGDTTRLLLQGEVTIAVGAYDFGGKAAVVWIDRIASAEGTITQLAAWFDVLENPSERSGLGMSGRRVLVTASAFGAVSLDTALLRREAPPPSALLDEGAARLAAYLAGLDAAPLPDLAARPALDPVPIPPEPVPEPGGPPLPPELVEAPPPPPPPPVQGPPAIFDPAGTVWFSFQEVAVTPGDDENVITATGSVVLHYVSDREGPWSQLTLSADRAVVFTDPGDLQAVLGGKVAAESVRGIYLEGNVIATAGDDEYTVRAPRMYYDLRADKAIMLDAVLRTYARQIGATVYARAAEMRQLAANEWSAERAKVSTSEFFTPHFAVGAARVTVTQRPGEREPQEMETIVESSHNTLELNGLPIFYWPHASGRAEDEIPLRTIQAGYSNIYGAIIETSWNPFALLGLERPAGVDAQVRADGYTSRGAGGGIEGTWDLDWMRGALDLYGLYDTGTDRTSSGLDVVPSSRPWRGIATFEHQMDLTPSWSFQAQGSYISDETFVTSWRELDFYNRREYETAAYLKYQNDRSVFDSLVKYNLNDFISNSYLLASRGYQVQKVPEFSYRRYGDSLFDIGTYTGETSVSRVMFNFETGTPASLGVPGAAFGLGANDSITASFLAAGFPAEWVSRFDSRHELSVPFTFGSFHFAPYAVGRLTAWDNDFQSFSTEAQRLRIFAAAGLRMSAEFQHVNDAVESRLFDLHRVRHILEPRASLWYGYSDVPEGSYPVYDETVEAIGGAAVAELGLRSTWQTKRGGPGRWRSVDFLTIDASAVFNSSEAFIQSPTPHFYAWRPEYSVFGNHIEGSAVWMVSDTFSIAGEANYDFDSSTLERLSIGGELQHSPQLSTFAEYRYIDADSNELLEIGWNYQITKKYAVSLRPQWDFVAGKFREIALLIERTFPDFKITVILARDEIADETTIAATMDLVEF